MRGRGEIIAILSLSVLLICFLYAMTYGGIVRAEEIEKEPERIKKQEDFDVEEEKRQMKEVKKILQEVGVGFCEEEEKETEGEVEQEKEAGKNRIARYSAAREGESVYTKVLEKSIGAIDVVDYNDPSWPVLEHWNEGRLGASSGESLYCANPQNKFQAGNKTAVDASKYYNKQTIQMIAAMFYYYDSNKCKGVSSNYDYLLKQCAVWWVLNEVHHWYGDNVQMETGNGVKCSDGHWISTHKSEYYRNGIVWARANYQYFTDAYGIIYEGSGQPLSQWGGTYHPTGTARLRKSSLNPDVTAENSCYSLEGAEYGIYSSSSLSGASKVGTFRTDGNGNTSSITLPEGTYYVKELKAPTGYALLDEVKTVTVKTGQETVIEMQDPPQMNPVQLLLKKTGADQEYTDPKGNQAYQGAQFCVKFYSAIWEDSDDPEKKGKVPDRTWIFETDEQAVCRYQESYQVSGDALYKMKDGTEAIPLGTVTIQEIKPPTGYLLNSEVFVCKITPTGTTEKIDVFHSPTVADHAFQIRLIKKAEDQELVLSGAKFLHTDPNGEEEDLTTDQEGNLKVVPLIPGIHKLKETEAPEGYRVNQNELIFQVDESGTVEILSETDASEGDVRFEYTKDGIGQVTMEDRLAFYQIEIRKENEKGKRLEGAEFTLYEDPACQKKICSRVTDKMGIATFENLETKVSYYLKETKAPEGYRLPVTGIGMVPVYEISLESRLGEQDYLLLVNGKEYTKQTGADEEISVDGSIRKWMVNIEIVNHTGKKLPETGSTGQMAVLTGILAIVALWSAGRRREQRMK